MGRDRWAPALSPGQAPSDRRRQRPPRPGSLIPCHPVSPVSLPGRAEGCCCYTFYYPFPSSWWLLSVAEVMSQTGRTARITSDPAASRPGPEGAPAAEDRKRRGSMKEGERGPLDPWQRADCPGSSIRDRDLGCDSADVAARRLLSSALTAVLAAVASLSRPLTLSFKVE